MSKIAAYVLHADRLAAWRGETRTPYCPACYRRLFAHVGLGKGRGISPAARRLLGIETWTTSDLFEEAPRCSDCGVPLAVTLIGLR
jgi:hypothetical protein